MKSFSDMLRISCNLVLIIIITVITVFVVAFAFQIHYNIGKVMGDAGHTDYAIEKYNLAIR